MTRQAVAFACAALAILSTAGAVSAESRESAPPAEASADAGELAKKLQNPVAALISVPFQSNFEWGAGQGSEGFRYLLNFQPVIPISLSKDWNLISRTIVPVNATVQQLLKIYKQPIAFQLGPKWYATGPTEAPDWGIRFAVTLLFPR